MKKNIKLTIVVLILNLIYYFCMLTLLGSIVLLSTEIPQAVGLTLVLFSMVALAPICIKAENLLFKTKEEKHET